MHITPLPAQQISFASLPVKKYGDASFRLAATASSGLPLTFSSSNPSVATFVNDEIRIAGAGTTEITATQPGNVNWAAATPVKQTLTVQKVPLIIKADNKTKNQGEANPPLTATFIGFVNGDSEAALTTQPAFSTNAGLSSIGGNYYIVVQGATSNNYLIQHQSGVLTVLPPQGAGQDNVNAWLSAPGQVQVNLHAAADTKVSIQLFDVHGARLLNTAVAAKKGYNTYRLFVGQASAGVYNLRVTGNGVMLKTKLMIQ